MRPGGCKEGVEGIKGWDGGIRGCLIRVKGVIVNFAPLLAFYCSKTVKVYLEVMGWARVLGDRDTPGGQNDKI